jgi:hypothetical protein
VTFVDDHQHHNHCYKRRGREAEGVETVNSASNGLAKHAQNTNFLCLPRATSQQNKGTFRRVRGSEEEERRNYKIQSKLNKNKLQSRAGVKKRCCGGREGEGEGGPTREKNGCERSTRGDE